MYRVLMKVTRSTHNGDGSLRYDVGDLLPTSHPDVDKYLGDAAQPTAFLVVPGGLVDTSERTSQLIPDDRILGPRVTYGEVNTKSLYGPVTEPKPETKPEPKKEKAKAEPEKKADTEPVPDKTAVEHHKAATLSESGSAQEATGDAATPTKGSQK